MTFLNADAVVTFLNPLVYICSFGRQRVVVLVPHRIHVWYIYLRLLYKSTNVVYIPWMVWGWFFAFEVGNHLMSRFLVIDLLVFFPLLTYSFKDLVPTSRA